jgi:hypothetical protein
MDVKEENETALLNNNFETGWLPPHGSSTA